MPWVDDGKGLRVWKDEPGQRQVSGFRRPGDDKQVRPPAAAPIVRPFASRGAMANLPTRLGWISSPLGVGALIAAVLAAVLLPTWLLVRSTSPDATPELLDSLQPSIVTVLVASATTSGSGSAFAVDSAGHFVTAAHVAHAGNVFTIVASNKATYPATVRAVDDSNDVAELFAPAAATQHFLSLAAHVPGTGETVYVLGNPFGELPNTTTKGTVAAQSITASIAGVSYTNRIELDVTANGGNSGGPVVNKAGEVVGVLQGGIPGGHIAVAAPVSALSSDIRAWG